MLEEMNVKVRYGNGPRGWWGNLALAFPSFSIPNEWRRGKYESTARKSHNDRAHPVTPFGGLRMTRIIADKSEALNGWPEVLGRRR